MIIIDGNHLAYRILFANMRGLEDGGWNYYRHLFLTNIISSVNKFGDGKVVLAIDSKSWRKLIYPEYKANRKKDKDRSPVDFEEFFKFFNEFLKEINKNFPIMVMKVKYAEADDVAGVLAKYWSTNKYRIADEDLVVISSDKDMQQIKRFDNNIKVFDPIKKQFMLENEDEATIEFKYQAKIMLGDKGDNIPSVEKGVGMKRAAKILNLPVNERKAWFTDKPERLENWKRNIKLISLDKIPPTIENAVLNKYEKSMGYALGSFQNNVGPDIAQMKLALSNYCDKHDLKVVSERSPVLIDQFITSMRRTIALSNQENQ